MQQRESRQAVIVLAQMRGRDSWSDITIRNISPHGMLILASRPPKPGDYVEIRKSSLILVGRAVWVKGKAFGVQLIERLNFNALLKAANESFAAGRTSVDFAVRETAPKVIQPDPVSRGGATRAVTWLITATFLTLAIICATIESGIGTIP
jgi:hypothetical protein